MTDLERELRELGDRVAAEIGSSPEMTEQVFRRARTRRVFTAVAGMMVIAAVGLASVVAAGALTDPRPRQPVAPQPSESPSPAETLAPDVGRDIGLGFMVCDVSRLAGIDLLGDGTAGTAWTATTLRDDGRCRVTMDDAYLVAVDVTGDGRADAWWEALETCLVCRPFDVTDFDGDGVDELVVLVQGGSVAQYAVFSARAAGEGPIEFGPVPVAPPGNLPGELRPGAPVNFWVGGDEGFSGAVACENYPEDPVLVIGWSNHPVDGRGAETREIHLTRLVLRDGTFEVLDALNTEQPTDDPLPVGFPAGDRACGLNLSPF